MMDRNYPSSSFADGLAPAAQTAASWAFDRGSANIKSSPGYDSALIDAELLPRQSYASTHQLPTYTTSNIPVATGTLESSSGTPETSIMSFLSAMESRGLQTGPVGSSVLPPFRPPSWPAGSNSSTTELYLTGALASSSTYPSPAPLSSYQHTGTYSSRTYSPNPSLALQDPAFSTSTNSPFSDHNTLLSVRPSQSVLPTALAFSHLSTTALSSALPVQSSTYRSAQESAPHLLQPQYSLLPSTFANQPYGSTIFSGSVERALQRECSVIKHHQRPSSSHPVSEQLSDSEHSLQGYFGSNSQADVSFQQDHSRLTPVSYSSSTGPDSTLGVNSSPQHETACVSRAYSSTALPEAKDCSSKLVAPPAEDEDGHSQTLAAESPEHYSSPEQKQNSVIAKQQEDQLSSLLDTSLSQSYITNHSQSQTSSISDKFSSLYKTLPSLSSQSDNMPSVSQTLVYASTPLLHQQQEAQYEAQVQNLCRGNVSEGYSTVHTQGAPDVSFKSQSQGVVSVGHTQSYHTRQQVNSSYSQDCIRGLATSNSKVGNTHLIQAVDAVGEAAHGSVSREHMQSHKYVLYVPSYSSNCQTLENNIRSPEQDIKQTYDKHKLEDLQLQDLVGLQQGAIEMSGVDNVMACHNHVVYVVSKTDDHPKSQSVIRSNPRDDQLLGHGQTAHVKDEGIDPLKQQRIHPSASNGPEAANTKTLNSTIVSTHVTQHSVQHESSEQEQQNQQNPSEAPTQFTTIPSTQVLFEPNQMVLLQQPPDQQSQNNSKVLSLQSIQATQGIGPIHIQYLQMDRELLGNGISETQSRQDTVVSEPNLECAPSRKHHYSQSGNQPPNDAKNHFALNTICFPDSMLLGDDRSILSNVDDILAATVAACGVAPQDFVKAQSSEGEMAAMMNPVDSKGHFQAVDIRHMSPSFSSAQQPNITNSLSHTIAITPNGHQMASDCRVQTVHHSNRTALNTNENGPNSESDYHVTGHVYNPPGSQNSAKGNAKCIKVEDSLTKVSSGDDFPKKNVRSATKPSGPEDDDGLARSAKRGGQAKRQNSRGSDASDVEGCPQQERIIRKIREVEEKQPEVRTGFIGSFLDFIKSGPKQHHSQNSARPANRTRKPSSSSKQNALPTLPGLTALHSKNPMPPLIPMPSLAANSHQRRLDEELRKNLETLPSFSSDEEENTGKNQALRNSISSVLSSLDEPTDRRTKTDNQIQESMMKPEAKIPMLSFTVTETCLPQAPAPTQTPGPVPVPIPTGAAVTAKEEYKETPPDQLAAKLRTVAVEGLTDEELSDSGGEGMYRERDEFVVRNEDIENLKVTMVEGCEPPAIWKVQKALLQKFVPELREGKRVFSATNSYLGYFGDAKTMYHRVYVKFLDTVNKKEYVRVCSRKPRCKPINSLSAQVKTLLGLTSNPPSMAQSPKPRPKPVKLRAEPPPKKRKKWKEALSPAVSASSAEECGEDHELNPTLASASRFLNTRTMKETFRSFVELLITISLDEVGTTALEKTKDELLLPNVRKMEELISDNRKRLLHKLHIGTVLKSALDSFPEMAVVTEPKKDGETPASKIRLSGKAYNKKTMKPYKTLNKVPQEYTVDQQKTQWFSLYHSLQHYKYHMYLMCKDEVTSLRVQVGDLGKGQTVQKCLQNAVWVEGLFVRFGELINQVQQVCR
ncbi:glutamine and serine-rich protein 1 isoform X2 [Gouania willdenowi]|uniref:glutamine and serine-rich protein 1 isoform X2 n=1 Tax=Gouania willdenowi TaxID=441366 RepID=UPI001054963F|nr:glutamine and serine-rich protein 1 isoform X2 [Gouania willdenowi]